MAKGRKSVAEKRSAPSAKEGEAPKVSVSESASSFEMEFVVVGPSSGDVVCCVNGCNQAAVTTWKSTTNPEEEWHGCEGCQLAVRGGWQEDKDPRTTVDATEKAASTDVDDAKADDSTGKEVLAVSGDKVIVEPSVPKKSNSDIAPDATISSVNVTTESEAVTTGTKDETPDSNAAQRDVESPEEPTKETYKSNDDMKDTGSDDPASTDDIDAVDNTTDQIASTVTSDGGSKEEVSASNKQDDEEVVGNETNNEDESMESGDDEEVPAKWELIDVLSAEEVLNEKRLCTTTKCKLLGCSVWVPDTDPDDKWYLCLECQQNDFQGWPPANELPITKMTEEHFNVLVKHCAKKKTSKAHQMPSFEKSESATEITPHKTDALEDQVAPTDAITCGEDGEEEQWDLIKVLTAAEVTDNRILCTSRECNLLGCCVWKSNQDQRSWYLCLDCQEMDFGDWPTGDDLPIKSMDEEHKHTLAKFCSRKKFPQMPSFMAGTANLRVTTPIPPSQAVMGKIKKDGKSLVTPSPHPSKKSVEAFAKWQKEAVALAGPGAKIIVAKPEAKKMVFDYLHDAFAPKNITEIYTSFKGCIPRAILNGCLNEMEKDITNPFDGDSDDEAEAGRPTKKKEQTENKSSDQHAGSLLFKVGKGGNQSNNKLYYLDYSKLKNNGNGLDPTERNEVASQLVLAAANLAELTGQEQGDNGKALNLNKEPLNEEVDNLLAVEEPALEALRDEVETARGLKVNEKQKKDTKRRIAMYTGEWRKRKRLCTEGLLRLEEMSEGVISLNKILKGNGQIDIDSDEAALSTAKAAYEAKKRRKLVVNRGNGALQADEKFIFVELGADGVAKRVYMD